MIIVYVADENYKAYLEQSIKSFKKYNPNAQFVVMTEKPFNCSIPCFKCALPKVFRNRGTGDRITNAAYLKLFLTKLPHDKILYVDGDTICQAPLNELWDMPCNYINICESHSFGKKQAQALGHKRYANTGMMVMNLANLRKINFTEKCLDVEKNFPTPKTGWQHDETCINVAMKDYLNFIDKKWNYCHGRNYDDPIPEAEAKILHYIGKYKEEMLELPFYKNLPLDEIKGKSVAIVGNAKSIFDTSYGNEIDSHDVVIRFNKGFPNKKESQGKKTTLVMLACELSKPDREFFNAKYLIGRSKCYDNPVDFTVSNKDRSLLSDVLGSQPSSGFIAIDMCMTANAKSITLYGFDGGTSPTYYNPEGYKTPHNYNKEYELIKLYEQHGLLRRKL